LCHTERPTRAAPNAKRYLYIELFSVTGPQRLTDPVRQETAFQIDPLYSFHLFAFFLRYRFRRRVNTANTVAAQCRDRTDHDYPLLLMLLAASSDRYLTRYLE
jgi:hypothetical protein